MRPPLPQGWCQMCDEWFLLAPNVRFVSAVSDGQTQVELVRPCCSRSWVAWVPASVGEMLRPWVERRFDVEFEVAAFAAELSCAGDEAAALIGGGR